MYLKKSLLVLPFLLAFFVTGVLTASDPTAGRAAFAAGEPEAAAQYPNFLPVVLHQVHAPTLFGVGMEAIADSNRLDLVVDANLDWARVAGMYWSAVEPVKGDGYKWENVADLSTQLTNAKNAGIQPILVINSTPAWAQLHAGYSCGPMQTQYYDEFGAFLAAVVQRYSNSPYNVRHFEIWNEPDIDRSLVPQNAGYGCWGDKNDSYYGGRTYGNMLKVVYPLMKAANPNAQVLLGGLLLDCDPRNPPAGSDCKPAKFLEGILVAGAKNSFDIVNFHAYDYYNPVYDTFGNTNWKTGKLLNEPAGTLVPVISAKLGFLKEVLAKYNVTGKKFINTETALLCGKSSDPEGSPGCEAVDSSPFEQMKAGYVVVSYATAMAEGLEANTWYSMGGWMNTGLLYGNLNPRPAFHALAFARETLGEMKYQGKVTTYPGITGFKFDYLGVAPLWVLWSADNAPHAITLPAVPQSIRDALGNSLPVNGTAITLTAEPVYIDFP